MNLQIRNGRIVTPCGITTGTLNLVGDKIASFGEDFTPDRVIDAEGQYVTPGFIDIHTHGGGGYDFMDCSEEAFFKAARTHAEHGTTTLLPTLLSASTEEIFGALSIFEKIKNTPHDGANMPGLHLEGPYFSPKQCGAQDPNQVRRPDPAEYMKCLEASSSIMRWSAAPELPGAPEFARELTRRGILPSIAHTDATYEEVIPAFEAGFTHITHLYSSMSTVHRIDCFRHAGVLESAFLIDGMTVELIADGCHLPSSLLTFATKFKRPDQVALITDSSRGAGTSDKYFRLGSVKAGMDVVVEKGVAMLLDHSSFAGSIATFDRLVRTMMTMTSCSLSDIITMSTITPATICRIPNKGLLRPGYDADVVIFDPDVNVSHTIIGGRVVYEAK